MYFLPKLSSASLAIVGLCLMVGCTASTPVASVDDTTAQATTSPTVDSEASASASGDVTTVFSEDGIAIRGADPVAYFTEGDYVPGSADYTYEWRGVTWQFASPEHRDLFASNPEQYAPQYAGFCAWAVSQGYVAPIDPTAWKIVDGKLYLNFNANIQRRWERDIPGNIAKADQNWPSVLNN